jgi:hypothetical protein
MKNRNLKNINNKNYLLLDSLIINCFMIFFFCKVEPLTRRRGLSLFFSNCLNTYIELTKYCIGHIYIVYGLFKIKIS